MSLSTRVLVALVLGVAAGLVLNRTSPAAASAVVAAVEPVGTLFVNAIRVTVIPLVLGSLIVGIATAGGGAVVRRIGGRGLVIFLILLLASGILAAIVAPPVLAHVTLDQASVAKVRAASASNAGSSAAGASAIQTPGQWLVSLVPTNAVSAAAEGAMLPLITFGFLFGLALTALTAEQRDPVVRIFRGIVEAMLVIVRWLLIVAPIGVFALALPLVARLGLSAIGALAAYVVLVSLVSAVFSAAVLYPAAAIGGRISLREFARAALPAQAVAFSSRSSLAALPALIDSARTRLHLPEEIPSFFIPLAVVLFRVGATCGLTTGALFLARVYGIGISPAQLATIVVTAVATSFSIPGIPNGSIIAMVPVLTAVGLPVEGIGILFGVDTIPDMFRTTANVTGQLAAAVIVARGERQPADQPE
ncbi:MAG TPA: dicarboxylate/amino acid:cation symporter [Gemmatimonadaceae bacterium]|nr:dicarboxylate/amino acid:cation symporter [Gemmatimonadaceae bacterium]